MLRTSTHPVCQKRLSRVWCGEVVQRVLNLPRVRARQFWLKICQKLPPQLAMLSVPGNPEKTNSQGTSIVIIWISGIAPVYQIKHLSPELFRTQHTLYIISHYVSSYIARLVHLSLKQRAVQHVNLTSICFDQRQSSTTKVWPANQCESEHFLRPLIISTSKVKPC